MQNSPFQVTLTLIYFSNLNKGKERPRALVGTFCKMMWDKDLGTYVTYAMQDINPSCIRRFIHEKAVWKALLFCASFLLNMRNLSGFHRILTSSQNSLFLRTVTPKWVIVNIYLSIPHVTIASWSKLVCGKRAIFGQRCTPQTTTTTTRPISLAAAAAAHSWMHGIL